LRSVFVVFAAGAGRLGGDALRTRATRLLAAAADPADRAMLPDRHFVHRRRPSVQQRSRATTASFRAGGALPRFA